MVDSTGGEAAGSVTNEEGSARPCRCCFDVLRQPQQPAADNRCPDQKRTTTGGWQGARAAGSGRTGGTHYKHLPRWYKRPPKGNRPSTGKLRWQSRRPGGVQQHRRQRAVGSTVTGRIPTAQYSKRKQQGVKGTCDRRRRAGRWETPCDCSDQARKGCSTDGCTGRRHQPGSVTPRVRLAPYIHQLPEPRRRIRAPTREHKRGFSPLPFSPAPPPPPAALARTPPPLHSLRPPWAGKGLADGPPHESARAHLCGGRLQRAAAVAVSRRAPTSSSGAAGEGTCSVALSAWSGRARLLTVEPPLAGPTRHPPTAPHSVSAPPPGSSLGSGLTAVTDGRC